MGYLKEKEDIEVRVVGIGVDVKPDWCTERSVLAEKCLVAGLLLGKNQCRWARKIWLWLWVGIVGEKRGVVIVRLVTCQNWVVLVEFVSEWLKA
jgi:hypothetical protein